MREDSLLRPVFSLFVLVLALGYYITGSATWGIESQWLNMRFIKFRLFEGMHNFTETELAQYTGKDPKLPIYLAINGEVYDVTAKRETYGPTGSYSFFSGRDAARAFGTGCFKTDLTYDLRGLDESTLEAIEGWQDFFRNHAKYWQVGYVYHEPPTGEIPPPCDAAKRPH